MLGLPNLVPRCLFRSLLHKPLETAVTIRHKIIVDGLILHYEQQKSENFC
jgi:hypothetical protein